MGIKPKEKKKVEEEREAKRGHSTQTYTKSVRQTASNLMINTNKEVQRQTTKNLIKTKDKRKKGKK